MVIWPRVQAMWASPDLESIELRNTMPPSTFDSLLVVRDRFWVVTSQRRYGVVADRTAGSSNGSAVTAIAC